ncbi:unnamed protein product [marine sediment metagenome]|uniref:Uncharacterized protein n=1 Tax=marine sediment metagenome TaxID=412755 RepID=X1FY65_9ZZZZ
MKLYPWQYELFEKMNWFDKWSIHCLLCVAYKKLFLRYKCKECKYNPKKK